MTATLRDMPEDQPSLRLPPTPPGFPAFEIEAPVIPADPPAPTKRPYLVIGAAAAIVLALIVAWCAGRASGYNTGHGKGAAEALQQCGEGLDGAGLIGGLASRAAPSGHRLVVCAAPDQLFDD